MRATPAGRVGLCAVAAVAIGGCGGTGALDVGSDLERDLERDLEPEGGVVAGFDATTETSSGLSVSIAEETPDACSQPCLELTARAAGGVAPYTYQWSPSLSADAGVATVCPAGATSVTVTVTDSSTRLAGEVPAAGATASATVVAAARGCAAFVDAGSFVYWADWQDVDGGWMSGVLSPPSGTIQVVYTGPLAGSQTTTGDNDFTPSATFTSTTVADPPPGPGMIEVSGGVTATTPPDTLTFSEPVTNPVLAIYNLGMGYALDSASLLFGAPFTVLSSGPNAGGVTYFGGETLIPVDGGVSGTGGNGIVELEGTFTTIQWPNPDETMYATFTGITVGIRTQR